MSVDMNLDKFREACHKYINKKDASNNLRFNYLFERDIDICNYMINFLPSQFNIYNLSNKINITELILDSLDEFKKFDIANYHRLFNLINEIDFVTSNNEHHFLIKMTHFNNKVYPGVVNIVPHSYVIPKNVYDIDVYTLTHEHCHSLKDTNPLEAKNNLIFGEVIPIFYELFTLDYENPKKIIMLENRLKHLNYIKYDYIMANELIKEEIGCTYFEYDEEEYYMRSVYEYIRSYIGRYLNSFYYAIILYNMYKENPKKILGYVSKVLNHELTTYDMLIDLNIYGDIKGEVFENEINSIKRSLKIK